jgi:hypothetical protein
MPMMVVWSKTSQHAVTINAPTLVVGRAPSADVVVADPYVSYEHLRLAWNGTSCTVADLGSTNGALLNESRLTDMPRELSSGDVIRIGQTVLTYVSQNVSTGSLRRVDDADRDAGLVRPAADLPETGSLAPPPPVPQNATQRFYRVLISHHPTDDDLAAEIAKRLERNAMATWLDHRDAAVESDQQAALEKVDAMVVVLTPTSVALKSIWDASTSAAQLGKVIIPIVALPCDISNHWTSYEIVDLTADKQAGLKRLIAMLNAEKAVTD